MALVQKIGKEDLEEEVEELWFSQDFRTPEQQQCDANGSGARLLWTVSETIVPSEGEVVPSTEEESPKGKPGILYPEGIKSIAEVDKEYEQQRKDKPFFRDDNGVQSVPAFG